MLKTGSFRLYLQKSIISTFSVLIVKLKWVQYGNIPNGQKIGSYIELTLSCLFIYF